MRRRWSTRRTRSSWAAWWAPRGGDQGWLVPLLEGVRASFGVVPEAVLADAGDRNEADFVSLGREGKACVSADPHRCPATRRMADKLGARWVGLATAVASGSPKVRTAGSRRSWASGGSVRAVPKRYAVSGTWSAWRSTSSAWEGWRHAEHGTGVAVPGSTHVTRYPAGYHHRDVMTRRGIPSHITRPNRQSPSQANS